MPFLFKLSRRWAGLGPAVAAATLLVAGCESRRLVSPDAVARIDLSPPAITVQPSQAADFSYQSATTPIANTDAYTIDTFGVLKLTLYATAYTWEFIPVEGKTFTDTGSGSCH